VRRAVDRGAPPGSFLLTGSIANADVNIHSGAGRILRARMYPLSLAERNITAPTVSLGALLSSREPFGAPVGGETSLTIDDYLREILASGLPGIRPYSPGIRKRMIGAYLDNMLSHEFIQQGLRLRQPQTLLRWLRAYAAGIATDAGYNALLDASTGGEANKPAAKTAIAYREALGNLWLIDELPVWLAGEDYHSRLKRSPKHYLADPAFAARLLGIGEDLLEPGEGRPTRFDERYGGITGRLFESLVQESLRVYASVNNAGLSYLRTQNGDHEIDFIVESAAERKIVAVEVKLAARITDGDCRHLRWLRGLAPDVLWDALVITTGSAAYRRPDGIAVVPAALLGR